MREPSVAIGQIAAAVGGSLVGSSDVAGSSRATGTAVQTTVHVRDISHDSRSVTPGSLFCCVRGARHDAHSFAGVAVRAGAVALLVDRVLDVAVPQIVVPDVRSALGPAAAEFWNHPWRHCAMVGVTGTAGKTSVSNAIADISRANGMRCEVIGTMSGPRTTPEAPDLYRTVHQAVADGTDMVVVEVSSHALELGRVDGAHFSVGAFTNLSHEHLDFHGTMEHYFAAKAKLFDGRTDVAVVNDADAWGHRLASMLESPADSAVDSTDRDSVRDPRSEPHGTSVAKLVKWRPEDLTEIMPAMSGMTARWRGHAVECGLVGRVNAANVACAAAAAVALGMSETDVAAGIRAIQPLAGRMWPASVQGDDVTVLVDFAHKPGALSAVLSSARELMGAQRRVWVVFGAGGERDPSKRSLMGEVADRYADAIVLTSDNPRSEDPGTICTEIAAGITQRRSAIEELHVELDRERAIAFAIERASPGDVILIAGKGSETTQERATSSAPFVDAEIAVQELTRRRGRSR